MTPLRRLRWRLTAWYVGVFTLLLLLLGTGLFLVIAQEISNDLDQELRTAVQDVARGARIELSRGSRPERGLIGAMDEASSPDRVLYLFDSRGQPVLPAEVEDSQVANAALGILTGRPFDRQFTSATGQRWRMYGEKFDPERGPPYAIVAVADAEELEAKFERLVEAFIAAGLLALVPVGLGGYYLAGVSTAPVERSMEQMRRFTADVAHELRTPIAVIRGRAEVALEQSREPAAYQAALHEIARESEVLGGIVGDLFTLIRADAGEPPTRRERVYLDDLVSDVVSAAGVLARARNVRLQVDRYEEAPVSGDPTLLRQLLMILLDNAVKFTPEGHAICVDVYAVEGCARVVVADEGIGIPASAIPHIFERFYRADPARERSGGAGLGLAIAAWIAEVHGAHISVESQPGHGTRFSVDFPALTETT